MKAGRGAVRLKDIDDALKILPTTNESPVVEVEDVEEQIRNFLFDAF